LLAGGFRLTFRDMPRIAHSSKPAPNLQVESDIKYTRHLLSVTMNIYLRHAFEVMYLADMLSVF
jgi:hypothetical protein